MRRKVAVVISSRASYSRFKKALCFLNNRADVDLCVILCASAATRMYGDVPRQIVEDGLHAWASLDTLNHADTLEAMVLTTGETMKRLASIFASIQPDAVVSIADRYETIATAIAASYQNIPLIHIQGGEVTGNIDEKVRHAVSKLADIHLVSTSKAKSNLLKMGENSNRVYVTGCPSCDLAEEVIQTHRCLSRDLISKYCLSGRDVKEQNYYVVLQHAVTGEQAFNKDHMLNVYEAVSKMEELCIWIMPNVDAGSKVVRSVIESKSRGNVVTIDAMDNMDFLELLLFCKGIIGNSSVGIRECSYMGVPAVNIGSRQFGRERGPNVIDCGYSTEEIVAAVHSINDTNRLRSFLYGDGHAAQKIADVIATCELSNQKTLYYPD